VTLDGLILRENTTKKIETVSFKTNFVGIQLLILENFRSLNSNNINESDSNLTF
jgi:hypothetical protein